MSSNLPTPTSNLIDYDLIRDLSLKMTDLQCQKFHFAGNKFRILGKVSTTVQCIKEGSLSGVNFHIKALVVSDLNKIMDTHCVAGVKMKDFLLSSSRTVDEDDGASHVSSKVSGASHMSPEMSQQVPDVPHVSSDARHVPHKVPNVHHVSPMAPDAHKMFRDDHVAPHVPSGVHDARHVPLVAPDVSHVPPDVPNPTPVSPSTGARVRHKNCVQCHEDLVGTIDREYIRCTSCHEKLLMMLAKMPHKWFQPAFREEMASVRGIQCKAEYSDLEYSDSDASSFCSQGSPFRRDWGREPWKRDWEERLKRKRR